MRDAIDYGATELCIQSGIHPDWEFDEYLRWLRIAKDEGPDLHLHAYSPMEIAHMQDITGGQSLQQIFEQLRDAGLGSTPAPPPRSSTTACASGSARTSCRSRAGSR